MNRKSNIWDSGSGWVFDEWVWAPNLGSYSPQIYVNEFVIFRWVFPPLNKTNPFEFLQTTNTHCGVATNHAPVAFEYLVAVGDRGGGEREEVEDQWVWIREAPGTEGIHQAYF